MAEYDSIGSCGPALSESHHHVLTHPGDMAQCHPDRPAISRGMCRGCYVRFLRETPPEQRPKPITKTKPRVSRSFAKCHPSRPLVARGLCRECYMAEYRNKHQDIHRYETDHKLRSRYGISVDERDAIGERQRWLCALCFEPSRNGMQLHVDHDHETGIVRGLLCAKCNWYLGKVDRDPLLLDRIRAYLAAKA